MKNEVRIIDANALYEKVYILDDYSGTVEYKRSVTCEDIEATPTIDPDSLRPKGRWLEHDTSRYGAPAYFCSCCFDIWESVQIKNMNFCPSCGADMRG